MDIVTHTLTGMTLGCTLAACWGRSRKENAGMIALGALGGMLPDLDAISMWSRFDATFGKWFHLSVPGKAIYSGKLWYSHHGFMHSLLAVLLFTLILWAIFKLIKYKQRKSLLLLSFAGGFIFHLLQDMITPASAWGGVRLFFPSPLYIGGTGNIWWWNNYDLFLIIALVFLCNFILLFLKFLPQKIKLPVCWSCFTLGFILFAFQVKTRNFNYNKHSYQESEKQSLQIQEKILPGFIYKNMEKLDNYLIVHF